MLYDFYISEYSNSSAADNDLNQWQQISLTQHSGL